MDALIRFSNGYAVFYPSLEELSEAAGFSRRAICRAIKDLKSRRMLMSCHRFASDGRQLSNEYCLKADTRGGA